MTSEESGWQAPEVSAITEADGASGHPQARIRNAVISGTT
jgi:hypothetical protein